ncbi:serine/threonine/tyrosine-interacting protein [Globomyces pollinis-pini]|nr:serine/threonine/tyrosine-interacting protein [Globomyces pollinis-pini]
MDPENWRYEQRNEMQEVYPGLFVGPYLAAKNLPELKRNGITHIVCIRDGQELYMKPFYPNEFQYEIVQLSNSSFENLIPHLGKLNQLMYQTLNSGGRILVHCTGGISRAPAIIIGYLMECCGMSFDNAYNRIQEIRFCINPLEIFKVQLKEYEPILLAKSTIGGQDNHTTKRTMDDESSSNNPFVHKDFIQ